MPTDKQRQLSDVLMRALIRADRDGLIELGSESATFTIDYSPNATRSSNNETRAVLTLVVPAMPSCDNR